jgi:hypothetical protein
VRTIKLSFPELVDNKNNININNSSNIDDNILINNNKNTSSNSQNQNNSNSNSKIYINNNNVVGKPSYSQSLIEDPTANSHLVKKSLIEQSLVPPTPANTLNHNDTVTAQTNLIVNAVTTTTTASIVTKNLLQKSKSVDHEHGFYSIEQYPALENTIVVPIANVATVKPQKAIISDTQSVSNPNNNNKKSSVAAHSNKQIEKNNNSKNIEVSRKAKNAGVTSTAVDGIEDDFRALNVQSEQTTTTAGALTNNKKTKKEKLSAFQQPNDNNFSFSTGVDMTG